MKVLHILNRQSETGPGLRNLTQSDTEKDVWFSGYWDIPIAEAETLIGGMLYLHESKSKPSRFGGRVLAVEQVQRDEFARTARVKFKLRLMIEGRGVKWRGANHAMAHHGTILEVDE